MRNRASLNSVRGRVNFLRKHASSSAKQLTSCKRTCGSHPPCTPQAAGGRSQSACDRRRRAAGWSCSLHIFRRRARHRRAQGADFSGDRFRARLAARKGKNPRGCRAGIRGMLRTTSAVTPLWCLCATNWHPRFVRSSRSSTARTAGELRFRDNRQAGSQHHDQAAR